ncbi:MAG TPA: YibE/F family protein [Actinomycetota bacterium]|nr:YibE/F family protein [Actinomycetota bacterium]
MSRRSARAPIDVVLTVVAAIIAAGLIAGLVVLWPSEEPTAPSDALARGDLVEAVVEDVDPEGCSAQVGVDPSITCVRVRFRLEGGVEAGRTVSIDVTDAAIAPDLVPGDQVILEDLLTDVPGMPYALYDRDRADPLAWLALGFAALVVLLGRMRGFAALVGLALSLFLLLWFVLPAILEGRSPTLVASVGAGVIAYLVIYLAHGLTVRTTVAVLGTAAGVALAVVLSMVWVPLAELTGLVTETAYVIQATGVAIDPSGLLLAGIVIGALGAIDDVSVTQASAVWELHEADPSADGRGLFRAGMRVGRDHVGSIVNTLALAYVGASLPLLIVFRLSDLSLGRIVGSEIVATEIVRALVGSVGLVASMPITTWLAARVAGARRARTDPLRVSVDER